MARNTFAASRRSHRILRWLRSGRRVSIADVTESFDVQYPQARADLKLLEDLYDLQTDRDGRTKVWRWNQLDGDEAAWAAAAGRAAADAAETLIPGERLAAGIAAAMRGGSGRFDGETERVVERLADAIKVGVAWRPRHPERMGAHLAAALRELARPTPNWMYLRARDDPDRRDGGRLISPRRLVWSDGRLSVAGCTEGGFDIVDLAGLECFEPYRPAEHGTEPLRRNGDGAERDRHPAELDPDACESRLDAKWDDFDELLDHSLEVVASDATVRTVRFEVTGRWASRLRRYRLHPTQETTSTERGLAVEWRVACDAALASRMQAMVPELRILAPDELRRTVSMRLRRWLADGESTRGD